MTVVKATQTVVKATQTRSSLYPLSVEPWRVDFSALTETSPADRDKTGFHVRNVVLQNKLLEGKAPTLCIEDARALIIIGVTCRLAVPFMRRFGPEGNDYSTLAIRDVDRLNRETGWTLEGFGVPARQSVVVEVSFSRDFLSRWAANQRVELTLELERK